MLLLPAFVGAPEVNKVYHIDALTLLRALPSESVNAFILDLPYGSTASQWDSILPFEPMWKEVRRILTPRGAFLTTATEPFASHLRMSAIDLYKYDWVWIKTRPSDFIRAKLKPMNLYELICVFSLGTVANASSRQMNYYPQGLIHRRQYHKRDSYAAKNNIGRRPSQVTSYWKDEENYPSNVLYFPSVHNVGSNHPNEKPVALYEYLISTYTQPNDLVVDFCCGSGTTAVAARNLDRRFIIGDITPEYVAVARKRLAQPYTKNMFIEHNIEQRLEAVN